MRKNRKSDIERKTVLSNGNKASSVHEGVLSQAVPDTLFELYAAFSLVHILEDLLDKGGGVLTDAFYDLHLDIFGNSGVEQADQVIDGIHVTLIQYGLHGVELYMDIGRIEDTPDQGTGVKIFEAGFSLLRGDGYSPGAEQCTDKTELKQPGFKFPESELFAGLQLFVFLKLEVILPPFIRIPEGGIGICDLFKYLSMAAVFIRMIELDQVPVFGTDLFCITVYAEPQYFVKGFHTRISSKL